MKEFLTFVNNIIYQGAHTQKKTHWLLVVTFFFFFYQVCYSKNRTE